MKRTPLKRGKRLKSIGRVVTRERKTRRQFRDAVQSRCRVAASYTGLLNGCQGKCERCGELVPHWTMIEAHHIIPKSLGGSHDPGTNGAGLCGRCHRCVHGHFGDWKKWLKLPHKSNLESTTA